MGWSSVPTIAVQAAALALFANAAEAQATNVHRYNVKFVETSTNDVLGQSVTHAALASTDLRRQDTQLSRADLLGLMILVSIPNKQK